MLAPDIAHVVVRSYARWWAHPLSLDAALALHGLRLGETRLPSH
jgi:hypothetical protein